MEELLTVLTLQNEKVLSALEKISEKLDVLENIQSSLDTIDTKLMLLDGAPVGLDTEIGEINSSLSSIIEELQWQEELSAAAQIIKAIDSVAEAVRDAQ